MGGIDREIRTMVQAARRYLDGEIEYLTVYYAFIHSAWNAYMFSADPRIKCLVAEWAAMAERSRNEWPGAAGAISEDEFRKWLREQL